MLNFLVFLQSNVLDRALDWIFSHLDDMDSMDVSEGGRSAAESEGSRDPPSGPRVKDGPGSEFWARSDDDEIRWKKSELFCFWSNFVSSLVRVRTLCVHQPHGNEHDVRPLRLPHQEGPTVSWASPDVLTDWFGCLLTCARKSEYWLGSARKS